MSKAFTHSYQCGLTVLGTRVLEVMSEETQIFICTTGCCFCLSM